MTQFFRFVRLLLCAAAFATSLALVPFPALSQSLPPAPAVKVAVNPLTNKIYLVNEAAGTVTVLNAANDTTTTIPVGPQPRFIAVNPGTNRVYVNNAGNSSITVIDGANDTNLTPTPLPLGSHGPIAVNPATNVVYVVRLTGVGTDEVSYLNAATHSWYTIATRSYQPISIAVNPVTNILYAAHYATGDVRIIDGTFNSNNDHPESVSVGVWSRPFAIAINAVTDKVFGVTEDSRGPIFVLDGAMRRASFPTVPAGRAVEPKGIAVNPVTNKAYAVFRDEIVVIDGATQALTFVAAATGTGPVGVAVDSNSNKVYVATDAGTLLVLDGASNAITTRAIAPQAPSIGVNPLTRDIYVHGNTTTHLVGEAGAGPAAPITTSISPLPGDHAGSGPVTFTMTVSNGFGAGAPAVRKVYYQLDSREGAWSEASGTGPWTATIPAVGPGAHTLHAFAVDGQDAPLSSGPQSAPLVGAVASYAFSGSTPTASVTLSASASSSRAGDAVTFTAAVSGSLATPTGTVAFRDGATTIAGCGTIALASGSAQCVTSQLAAGTHSITAAYSGDGTYAAATSSALSHQVLHAQASLSDTGLDYGGQSMGTTSAAQAVTITNTGTAPLRVTSAGVSSGQFAQANDCGDLAPGARCTVAITFHPAVSASAALNAAIDVAGTLTVTTDAPGSPHAIALAGKAEKSLVSHYYRSILRRPPDDSGKAFWQDEAARMVSLGANVNEAWFAMATAFFSSGEYAAVGRDDTGFVTDLYRTFFNRDPDAEGLDHWQRQIAEGLPREVVLVSFLLSQEFDGFTRAIFGNAAARAEVDTVGDFYRGLLARLPDSPGFGFWVQRFRDAQCQGEAAVTAQAESISAAFAGGAEYANRSRTNAQYVSDLYNAFLRRGGDLAGVRFWIERLASGASTRDEVRRAFVGSPEFQARVRAIVNQGCMQ